MFDLIIASDFLALTKPHISEYSRFSLYLNCAANIFCADKASTTGILSAGYIIGVKVRLRYRQA